MIVLTDFLFTDLTAAKRRPALVICTDNDRRTDVMLTYITSIPRDEADRAGRRNRVPPAVRFNLWLF